MAPSRRRPRSLGQRPRQRLASVFLVIGCLAVLGGAFALGVAAGRRWPERLPLPGLGGPLAAATAARPERDAARRPETRGLDRDKVPDRPEATAPLTFYHELTAPLTPPPVPPRPAAKPVRAETKPGEAPRALSRPSEAKRPEAPAAESPPRERQESPAASPGDGAGGARFTVQVGSFKARVQAEALRARLAESGQDAYVSEVEVGGTAQYRVRVGSFPTREAARDAAMRLAAERRVTTYVTTR